MAASDNGQHMTATDYLISVHLSAQQRYCSMELMSVQKQKIALAEPTALLYSSATNRWIHSTHREVIIDTQRACTGGLCMVLSLCVCSLVTTLTCYHYTNLTFVCE